MASMTVANKAPLTISSDKVESFNKVCKEANSFKKTMERAERCCPGFADRSVIVLSNETIAAIKEVEEMERTPEAYAESYSSAAELFADVLGYVLN